MRILSIGLVHTGPCGVRDHGALLSQELRSDGDEVEEVWVTNDGKSFPDTWRATWKLLRAALTHRTSDAAIWHYSVFAYSFRGIPMPGVLAGMLLRLRGVPVVATLHEMTLPLGTRGRGRIQAICQHLVLPLVLGGSREIVVTTEGRAAWLQSTFCISDSRIHVIPVFSNFDTSTTSEDFAVAASFPGTHPKIGVPGWGSSPGLESILLRAATQPELVDRNLTIQLLGAPGPGSAEARRWLSAATTAGIGGRLQFTGVLTPERFNDHLRQCQVVAILFGDGPSSRHTMLAAALSNGCAIVALDGSDTWSALTSAGAVTIASPTPADLAAKIAYLFDNFAHRRLLGDRALKLYKERMAPSIAARSFRAILDRFNSQP